MTNFRQYKNEKLVFATDPNKNVTVIIGDNTNGKTTLVCSFIWCLYREFGLAGPILNSEVAKELSEGDETFAEVQMDLNHDNSEYRITTRQTFKKTNGNVDSIAKAKTTIVKDGKAITDQQAVNHEIQFILKQDVKDYFFYDGENNRIESVGKKRSLKSAIYQMMGIDTVVDIASYFNPTASGAVATKLNNDLVMDPTPELEVWKAQKESDEIERNKLVKEIEDNLTEIDKLIDQRTEKETILSANEDIEVDQRRKLILGLEIKDFQGKVDQYFGDMISVFNGRQISNLLSILYSKTFEDYKLRELPAQSSFSSKDSLSHINEMVIDQLIERGRCLCGTIITDSNDARKHLEAAREHMEPNDFGRHLKDFCDRMEHFVDNRESAIDRINEKCDDLLNLIEKIENDKIELKEIEERIKGRPDVGSIQESINSINQQITNLERTNEIDETRDIPRLEKRISDANEKIQELASKNGNNDLINKCLDYMEFVYETANSTVNKKRSEVRTELEKQVNDIFQFIYHGDRVVKIDEEFNISTELKDGEKLSASGGTESVKNFSFVSGLIKLVKRHILSEGNDAFSYESDDKYPLVLDAPFSGVDKIHTQNVCKILPEYCDQVIIVLLQEAYDMAEEILEQKVGKMYRIHRVTEKCSEIREVK